MKRTMLRTAGLIVSFLAGAATVAAQPELSVGMHVVDASKPDSTSIWFSSPSGKPWADIPGSAGARAQWVTPASGTGMPYVVRVRIAPKGRIPLHRHPDARLVTVLSGNVYAITVRGQDTHSYSAFGAGTTFIVPAGLAHEVWAEADSVEYQEVGFGQTGTEFLKR